MAYEARIEADSISPLGVRLTTFVVTYPRFIHSEMMTHRVFSRNSSSSRAIPHHKLLEQVEKDPVIPVYWGKNQSGMQAKEELSHEEQQLAISAWIHGRDAAISESKRLLEPWMWITVIISATEWDNFFRLRCHVDAQPEIQKIAGMMRDLYMGIVPKLLHPGQWHLTFVPNYEICDIATARDLSAARCARVSYLTHDGQHDPEKDLKLAKRLHESGHMSPFEHQATPVNDARAIPAGNFDGWHQYRHRLGTPDA